MTSTTCKIIIAVAAVAGQLLLVGTQRAEAIDTQTGIPPKPAPGKIYERIIRDHRANPVPWSLPKHYHNHNAGQGRRPR